MYAALLHGSLHLHAHPEPCIEYTNIMCAVPEPLSISHCLALISLQGTHIYGRFCCCNSLDTIVCLQEYVYKFNYENDGGVTVDVSTNGKPMAKGNKKKQVPACHLMLMLPLHLMPHQSILAATLETCKNLQL